MSCFHCPLPDSMLDNDHSLKVDADRISQIKKDIWELVLIGKNQLIVGSKSSHFFVWDQLVSGRQEETRSGRSDLCPPLQDYKAKRLPFGDYFDWYCNWWDKRDVTNVMFPLSPTTFHAIDNWWDRRDVTNVMFSLPPTTFHAIDNDHSLKVDTDRISQIKKIYLGAGFDRQE